VRGQRPLPDPTGREDRELVAAAANGDRAAVEALLRSHYDLVHQLCHRMCADRGDAEDATQEALIAIARGLSGFDGRARITTWMYRVATNACLDQLRRRARRPALLAPANDDAGQDRLQLLAADGAAPEHAAVLSELRVRLRAALDELPEEFRVAVVLRDLLDLDYAEIAAVLELPVGTVRSRISRGRSRLASAVPDLDPSTGNRDRPTDVKPLDGP
jgi:RNA polymerase sigma-70 factor, ECF subfamily